MSMDVVGRELPTLRQHVATGHDLPVTTGWSGSGEDREVWCGRCRRYFVCDEGWRQRAIAYQLKRWQRDEPDVSREMVINYWGLEA